MPDEASLHAAAGAAGVQQPDFRALLAARMYRMAVALLSKASGKRPCDDLVSATVCGLSSFQAS